MTNAPQPPAPDDDLVREADATMAAGSGQSTLPLIKRLRDRIVGRAAKGVATTRLTTYEIDQILGTTPCICGDLTTWHPRCYSGKTHEQIEAAYRRVYAKAREKIRSGRIAPPIARRG